MVLPSYLRVESMHRHRGQRIRGHRAHPLDHTQHRRRSRCSCILWPSRTPTLGQLHRRSSDRRSYQAVSSSSTAYDHHREPGATLRAARMACSASRQRRHRLDTSRSGSRRRGPLHQARESVPQKAFPSSSSPTCPAVEVALPLARLMRRRGTRCLSSANLHSRLRRQSDAGHVDLDEHYPFKPCACRDENVSVSAEGVVSITSGEPLQIIRMDPRAPVRAADRFQLS